jgi:uncharacterized iron-regulated membrane protein
MRASTVKVWELVHKWTSLTCTLFLLMLCITGLPLIFHDEIDEALNPDVWQPKYPQAEHLTLDEILEVALTHREDEQAIYMSFDILRPVINITSGPSAVAPSSEMHFTSYDLTSGELVPPSDVGESVMEFILQLHTDMFLGLPGMLFLGAMGVLFVVSTISGVVIYRQYMRKLDFGTIRRHKSIRHKWLDYHNLFGIVTVAWVLVVGGTGVINTLEEPILDTWRDNNLKQLLSEHQGGAIVEPSASLSEAVKQAKLIASNMTLQFVAFPGSKFSSNQHYAIFLHGNTPLTKELITPVLVDAINGEVIGLTEMPWYGKVLSLSRPLHFGDYGGLFLKILWAILDIITIIILGSGLYLWYKKNKKTNFNPTSKKSTE